ncbi:endonuclease, partial [Stenotrophomonas sp. SG1]|nr:endonuclease [Stenotrophomonas sp. SG1]
MKALHSLFLAAALAPALLSVAAPAHAWGAQGHRLVAEVADSRLNPAARAEV